MQFATRSDIFFGHRLKMPTTPFRQGIVILLIALLMIVVYPAPWTQPSLQLQRSSVEFITAGRDFMDHLLSMNAHTIINDQDRAIKMMVDQNLVRERFAFLKDTNLIQRALASDTVSYLDWQHATAKIIEVKPQYTTIKLSSPLYVGNEAVRNITMMLTLTPMPRSEDHPDGVGVLKYTDVSNAVALY